MKKLLLVALSVLLCLGAFADDYTNHFSFKPLSTPKLSVKSFPNGVDNVIASQMKTNGFLFASTADKATLINRLYNDLTGLPPSYEQIKAFVEDKSKDAYPKLVESLLSSERYGEKMARNWMDVARYSDTRGNINRNQDSDYVYAWTYRRYLIEAFNNDKPFDVFLKEQVAADLMVEKSQAPVESLAALGFLSIGKFDNNVNNRIDEKIDTLGKSMLGLTIACARCHDHKFDPISTKDYYSLHGIFSSLKEQSYTQMPAIEDTSSHPLYDEYVRKYNVITNDARQFRLQEFYKWTSHVRTNSPIYLSIAYFSQRVLSPSDSVDYLATNKVDKVEVIASTVRKWQREMTSNKPFWEAYRLYSTNSSISETQLSVLKDQDVAAYLKKERVKDPRTMVAAYAKLVGQAYEYSNRYYVTKKEIPTNSLPNKAFAEPIKFLFASDGPASLGPVDSFETALPNGPGNNFQREERRRESFLIQLEQTHPAAPRRAQLLLDGPAVTSKVFIKGDAGRRGEEAPKGFIRFFDETRYSQGTGRYELANSITSPTNTLTPRVISNRVWQWLFDKGLVEDPDNFGMLTPTPTQYELMDYLSGYLIQNKWSVKSLVRLIVTSETYKQSSVANAKMMVKDSDNKFLTRQNVHRLSFEELRDAMLLASGELELEHDGRPVGMFTSSKRSLHAKMDRSNVSTTLVSFDVATPDFSTGKRNKTIVPQQALFLMNDKYIQERIKVIVAHPSIARAIDETTKIEALYQRILRRDPQNVEVKLGINFIKEEGVNSYVHALLMSNEFAYVR